MSKSQIAHDLGKDLQEQIGELLERKIGVARQALGAAEISIMLIEACVSLNLTTAATIASMADDQKAGDVFDHTLSAIAAAAACDRERSLAAIRERRRQAA